MTSIALVFEPGIHGHRLSYLVNLTEALHSAGYYCVVGTDFGNEDALRKAFSNSLVPHALLIFARDLQALEATRVTTALISQWRYYKMLRALFRQCTSMIGAPTLIFAPYIDNHHLAITFAPWQFGEAIYSGISMRSQVANSTTASKRVPLSELVKEFVLRTLLKRRHVRYIYTIDPTLLHDCEARRFAPELLRKLIYFADPIETPKRAISDTLREDHSLPDSSIVILVYGALDSRKGIRQLLDGLVVSGSEVVKIMLVGEQSTEVKLLLSEERYRELFLRSQVLVVDRRIDDDEEYRYFEAADVVWVGYVGHRAMSGIVIKAAAYGVYLLGCSEGLISWFITTYKIGSTVDVKDSFAVSRALLWLVENVRSNHLPRFPGNFTASHTWEIAKARIVSDYCEVDLSNHA